MGLLLLACCWAARGWKADWGWQRPSVRVGTDFCPQPRFIRALGECNSLSHPVSHGSPVLPGVNPKGTNPRVGRESGRWSDHPSMEPLGLTGACSKKCPEGCAKEAPEAAAVPGPPPACYGHRRGRAGLTRVSQRAKTDAKRPRQGCRR